MASINQSKSEEQMKPDELNVKFRFCFNEDIVQKVLKGVLINETFIRTKEHVDANRKGN